MKPPPARFAGLLLGCALVTRLVAQQAAPPAAPSSPARTPSAAEVKAASATSSTSSSGDAVMLSPFEVNADLDTGYLATSAQSGTRLRTDLKDIAASVSVITKDFMSDLNANDLEGLLVYTAGTEVAGIGGNFSNATDTGQRYVEAENSNRGTNSATRVRGLGSADLTRDFFLTSLPVDGYILERAEISRGPNAALYGLGAPAGIINSGILRANLQRNKTTLNQQFGSYGTSRSTLDHNQMLIRDTLAVRVAGLYNDRRYRIEDTFRRDRRAFATFTLRPFKQGTTMIRANAETGHIDFNSPKNTPPLDNFSYWWRLGKPVWDATTGTTTLLGTRDPTAPAFTATSLQFGDVAWRLALVYPDPNSSTPLLAIPGDPIGMKTRGDRARLTNGTALPLVEGGMASLATGVNWNRALRPTTDPARNLYRWLPVTDPSLFDFYHYQLDGPNNRGFTSFEAFNASIEQRFLKDKLGFEFAFDVQSSTHSDYRSLTGQHYNIFLDINTKLLNGAPNPNFGRPMIAGHGTHSINDTRRATNRLTGYYELDLRRIRERTPWLGRVLGRHTFTATHTDMEVASFSRSGIPVTIGTDYELYEYGAIASKNGANRRVGRFAYLGPSVINAPGPQNLGFQPITAIQRFTPSGPARLLASQPPAANATALAPWSVQQFNLLATSPDNVDATATSANRNRQEFKSSVVVLTDRWLNNKVITVFSWRRDEWKSFQSSPVTLDPNTGTAISGEADLPSQFTLGGARENHANYGVTAHAPEFIRRRLPLGADVSLYLNRSDNFRPQRQRYDVYERPIESESGSTKEYGARLSLFGGKFELRASHYKTGANGATDTIVNPVPDGLAARVEALIEQASEPQGLYQTRASNDNPDAAQRAIYQQGLAAFNTWLQTPGAQQFMKTFQFQTSTAPNGVKTVTRASRAGEVISTVDTASEGWEFEAVFNPTRSWRIAFNGAQQSAMRDNSSLALRQLVTELFEPLWAGPFGSMHSTTNQAIIVRNEVAQPIYQPLNRAQVLDGTKAQEIREWRWSGVTNYTIREGRLKGWGIGGSVRWEAESVIGYDYKDVPEAGGAVLDLSKPYFAPSQTTFDAFLRYTRKIGRRVTWTGALHVRNIGVGNRIVPTFADPDGSISSYRIREPQSWTFSNTFEF
jgi:outer membrane receptor protein involved in Fe transport